MNPEPIPRSGAAALATAILCGAALFITSAWAGWLLGWPLHGALSCAATAIALLGLLRWTGLPLPRAATLVLAVFVLAALAAALSIPLYDLSDDGQQYHQQAVMLLNQGWNPLWEPRSPVSTRDALWINGYAKSHWVYAALLLNLGAGIESGKSLGLLLALAAGLLCHAFLRERLGWRRTPAALMAAVAALNPVFTCQWSTLLNDQAMASLITAALCALALVAGHGGTAETLARTDPARRGNAVLLLAALALLVSIKASGVAYGLMILAMSLPLLLWVHGRAAALRAGLLGATGLALGTLLLGFNPYITNTVAHGHPFYPLAGTGKVDIITHNAPPGVLDEPRAIKLLGSLAAPSSSVVGNAYEHHGASPLAPKWPGTVRLSELKPFLTKSFVHIGGLGPWFSLALVLAIAAGLWAWRRRSRPAWRQALLLGPAALLLLSGLAFPEPWWMRYVPQLWLIPLVVAASVITAGQAEQDIALRRAGWTVVAVAGLNAVVVALLFVVGNLPRQLDMRTQLDSLAALSASQPLRVAPGGAPAIRLRLEEAGVRWNPVDSPAACAAPDRWVPIEYTVAKVCLSESQQAAHRVSSAWIQKLRAGR